MATPAFPTLDGYFDPSSYVMEPAENPSVQSALENGMVYAAKRFTRIRYRFSLVYRTVTEANKEILEAFVEARGVSAEVFTWTAPGESSARTVRFTRSPSYRAVSGLPFWNIAVEVVEE